jgi:hypothetical protein
VAGAAGPAGPQGPQGLQGPQGTPGSLNAWSLTGNAGTSPGTNFLGTTDNQAFEIWVNNARAFRLEPGTNSGPNVIGGSSFNSAKVGIMGATVGGGGSGSAGNQVNDHWCTVGGGSGNLAGSVSGPPGSAQFATVAGGQANQATANLAFIGGGFGHMASGTAAVVAGGYNSTASGDYATVIGGFSNHASGQYSVACGRTASASDMGSFVWADTAGSLSSSGMNTFTARASNGFFLIGNVNATGNLNVSGSVTAGGMLLTSDRNAKANFLAVDTREIAARVALLPIETWNYKAEDPSVRHMGPMAQDFRAAFGLGTDERRINMIDEGGVALASVQGLYKIIQDKDSRISALETRNAKLEARLAAIEKALGLSTQEVKNEK